VNAIRLELKHGHLKWKVTDLSRAAKISRSQIYEKLGSNKTSILKTSLTLILDELYGFAPEHRDFCKTHGEFQGLLRSRQVVFDSPELLSFYFLHRNNTSDYGALIREKETQFLNFVAQKNQITNDTALLFIRTFIHGVSVAPFLNDEQVSDCMGVLSSFVKGHVHAERPK